MMDVQTMSVRLPVDLYEHLRREAFERRVPMNAILVEALGPHLDKSAVTLVTRDQNQAQRLRRLAREHGALGEPFPNNEHPTWQVCEGGQPVDPHGVVSVAVKLPDGAGAE
jgi:hypothetical protein